MPAGSLLALLDDITTILDDVAVLTKKATAKTAGVLGDDLALNAKQVSGVVASRELPVVWAVAKGSFLNKLILVPLALVISTVAPWAVLPLLMVGGAYLCYEGVEKIVHSLMHRGSGDSDHGETALTAGPDTELEESEKIRGAVRTDFVLSAEIITISLGTVAGESMLRQASVLAAIAVIMTVGVYGLVALIVKIDDAGLYLEQSRHSAARRGGAAILIAAPWLMRSLSVLGTAAMFLVGGGIVTHGIPWLHHHIESLAASLAATATVGPLLEFLAGPVLNGICGLVTGGLALGAVAGWRGCAGKLRR